MNDENAIFVPLTLELVNEGNFVDEINEALQEAQGELIKHVEKHELKAKGAKVVLNVKIVMACMDPEARSYGCAASIKKVSPDRPAIVSMLIASNTQDDKKRLLCRRSGSSRDVPHQQKICTEDGRPIDVDTGVVLEV